MNTTVALACFLIILARIGDVTLGTFRTICVVQGRAVTAWFVGFFEILIWIFAVSQVIHNLDSPFYSVSYALGYASGNYLGIKVESYVAFGQQVIRIFTRKGRVLADSVRELGFRVTSFDGEGRGGHVHLLFIETPRRDTPRLLRHAARADPECYYLVDDIRLAAHPAAVFQNPTGWRAVLKKK
jgi:uncharacterized protein YebE (UPF0316 family)